MILLETLLAMLALGGLIFGGWSIVLARTHPNPARASWGRRLFVAIVIGLGVCGSVAALHRADGLVSVSLLAGLLLVGMLWDHPAHEKQNWESTPKQAVQDVLAS